MNKNLNAHYHWKGIFPNGEKTQGIIQASSVNQARHELRKQGIITRKITKKYPLLSSSKQTIKSSEINIFIRQLATLLNASVPLSQSLNILKLACTRSGFNTFIEKIQTDVESGLMLSQALNNYPTHFNSLFCSMIHAGEQSGKLDVMLLKIATYKENTARIQTKIRKAMAYPLLVSLIAIIISIAMLMYVIPQFEALFKNFDANLPQLTRTVIDVAAFLKTWWAIIAGLIITTIYGCIYAYKHIFVFSNMSNRLLLLLPILGPILQNIVIARFTRTLAITFAAGLSLTNALQYVACVTGNRIYTQAIYKIKEEVSQGQSLQNAIKNTRLFPNMVIQFIAIGEESGTLEQMLIKIADFYDNDVDTSINALSSLLEPVIMTILGLFIGGLIIAMYLPILQLGSIV